jgi:hypothetical protein
VPGPLVDPVVGGAVEDVAGRPVGVLPPEGRAVVVEVEDPTPPAGAAAAGPALAPVETCPDCRRRVKCPADRIPSVAEPVAPEALASRLAAEADPPRA